MGKREHQKVKKFLDEQKEQLGLTEVEITEMLDQAMAEEEAATSPAPAAMPASNQDFAFEATHSMQRRKQKMSDPYLPESQTIKTRPTQVSRIRSLLYEHALPNEYIVEIGRRDAKPLLGGKFFRLNRRFLKFPAAVQTVYFTSDNANKNYQGLKIDGYACWRINPDHPEMAAATLDFNDQDNPMGNTNRILRTICTEAIRHIIANTSIEDALTKKDEIGRDLKEQLGRIERSWGIIFDQVGIERVTILSSQVFEDLQQKTRDQLRLNAAESRMVTDSEIEKQRSAHMEEMERLRSQTEKESRMLKAATETEIHNVELEQENRRLAEQRLAEEQRKKLEAETAERMAEQAAERAKREATRDKDIEIYKANEKQELEMANITAEAVMKERKVEAETQAAEKILALETKKADFEHAQAMKYKELALEKLLKDLEAEGRTEGARQKERLAQRAEEFNQEMKENRESALAKHEDERRRIEREKLEEEILNLVTKNRVLADLIEKLPEIVRAMPIEKYTVFDGSGTSPLVAQLAQIFSIAGENGLLERLGRTKAEE
jgi:hypothetical protein